MNDWAQQIPMPVWVLVGTVMGFWAAYLIMRIAHDVRESGGSMSDKERKQDPIEILAQNTGYIHADLETLNTWLHVLADLLRMEFVVAKSMTVTIGGNMGNTVLAVGKTAQATAHEWSGPAGSGSELPLKGAISWASADPSVCTVDQVSGLITAVAPSKVDANGAPIPVDITATDAANNLSNPSGDATITDSPLVAQSLTVTITPL